MLLDGTNGSGGSRLVDRMPATPDYQFETLEIPQQLPQSEPREPADPKVEAHNSEPEKSAVTVKPTAPVVPVTPPAAVKKKAAAPQKADGDSWVVQMGSFSSADNAHALRDKLRKHAFKAYVETIKSDGGGSYRVRVGPETSREKADALKERISKKLKLDSIVMPHSP